MCTGAVLRAPAVNRSKPIAWLWKVKSGAWRTMNDGGERQLRHYADDVIEISYDARRCIHAAMCIVGLPAVFDPQPAAVDMPSAASADEIANVIAQCPERSIALKRLDGGQPEIPQQPTTIVPTAAGPFMFAAFPTTVC